MKENKLKKLPIPSKPEAYNLANKVITKNIKIYLTSQEDNFSPLNYIIAIKEIENIKGEKIIDEWQVLKDDEEQEFVLNADYFENGKYEILIQSYCVIVGERVLSNPVYYQVYIFKDLLEEKEEMLYADCLVNKPKVQNIKGYLIKENDSLIFTESEDVSDKEKIKVEF